jgi:hypothetical protein
MAKKTMERRFHWHVRQLNMRKEVRPFVFYAIIEKLGAILLDCPLTMYRMDWEYHTYFFMLRNIP